MAARSQPGYLQLARSGELEHRARLLQSLYKACTLCPWKCGVNRTKGETGRCGASDALRVAKALAHFGEEPVLSGTGGSGTIFFSHCSLRCCFCQNHQISQEGLGNDIPAEALAGMMLDLQTRGCHNINLVSAAHYLPGFAAALCLAADRGLRLPIVYNSNGYENVETLKLLEGVVDIYLPDAKYAEDRTARQFSGARQYCRVNQAALQEMFRQAGPLAVDSRHVAVKGLIIRHLVLPGRLSETRRLLHRLRHTLGPFVPISLMGQYTPCFQAGRFAALSRRTPAQEYRAAVEALVELEFENGWFQECNGRGVDFVPDFSKPDDWN